MSGWKKVELGKIADFINGDRGKNYPSEGDFIDSGIPFINAGHLADGKVDFTKMNYISGSRYQLLGSGKTQTNDILYCLRGSLGKTAIYRENARAAIASSLVIIRPGSECSVDYLYHFLASPLGQREIRKFDNGSSQPNLSATSLKNYVVPLPPLHEQQRITQVLDYAEALRAKRRQALAKLDTLTQSLFLEMFGDPSVNPIGWPMEDLGVVCDVRDGTHDSPKYVDVGFPLVTSKNLTSGQIDLSNVQRISADDFNTINRRSKVDVGDILMPMIGTIGSPVIVEEEPNFAIKNVALIKFMPRSPANYFVHAFLSSEHFEALVARGNRGGTQKFLSLGDIRSIRIPLPPQELQSQFGRRIRNVKNLFAAAQGSLIKIEEVVAALQHHAFRGEL